MEALGQLRGMQPSHVEKYGGALVAAVKQGLAVHDHELPRVETALKVRAVEASISPQLLATTADLELFALERGRGAAEKLPILQGWRRQLAGEHLLKVLEGKLSVGYDPETKQVRLFERP